MQANVFAVIINHRPARSVGRDWEPGRAEFHRRIAERRKKQMHFYGILHRHSSSQTAHRLLRSCSAPSSPFAAAWARLSGLWSLPSSRERPRCWARDRKSDSWNGTENRLPLLGDAEICPYREYQELPARTMIAFEGRLQSISIHTYTVATP